jgi:hypothetical protein
MAITAALSSPKSTSLNGETSSKSIESGAPVLQMRQPDTAQYVADMILELRNMAKACKLYQVMVPLEYAYYEAFSVANRVEVPDGEVERIHEMIKASQERDHPQEDY